MEEISLLPKTAEYALRVVASLAAGGPARATSRTLAEATGVPPRYLYRVLQALARAGIVQSRSGPGGGYQLARPADEISMLDVVQATGGIGRITSCPLGVERSDGRLCPLHRELDRAYAEVERAFASVKLADLVAQGPPLCAAGGLPIMRPQDSKRIEGSED